MARRFAFALLLPCLFFARGWTVMVYMAADNDLSAWADSDIVEMRTANFDDDAVAVIAQLDKPGTGANYLQITGGSVYNLGALGIIDMCDPKTLSDFIEGTIREFPADRYMLILWDHGTGWTAAPRRS
ncbi:MAG TPA: clostripain-related cysteine peptidase, partial [bacterium]